MAISTEALGQVVEARDAEAVVLDAIDLLATRLPEWVPRNGSLEVWLLEAVATAAGDVANTANAAVGAVVEAILSELYQVARLPGSVATGNLTLTFDTTVTTVVPTGTSFLLPDYDVELLSTADVTVTATDTATIPVQTSTATSAVNGLTSTAAVDVLDTVPNALTVAIDGTLSGGADPESDSAYLDRARWRLGRVTSSLVVADHFTAYVLEDGRASNATTIEAWDGAAIGTAGTDGSYVTTVAYGRGAVLSSTVRTELADAMQLLTAAGVTVAVVDADLETVAVTADLVALAGYSTGDVQAAAVAAVESWLAPETWEFGETVRVTTLTALLAAVEGVDYVDSVTLPAGDITLTANQVTTPGTVTISVS